MWLYCLQASCMHNHNDERRVSDRPCEKVFILVAVAGRSWWGTRHLYDWPGSNLIFYSAPHPEGPGASKPKSALGFGDVSEKFFLVNKL